MPWRERTVMSERLEFVTLARQGGATRGELCRRYGVSRKTGYKWLGRYEQAGGTGLADQSRRPVHSPWKTPAGVEAEVLRLREKHPAWGGRKLKARLVALGNGRVPSASTITEILRRHGKLDGRESEKHEAWQRFEAPCPNDLWQMDFKGHISAGRGRCHPLTVLDDSTRYAVGIEACANERNETVQERLIGVFRRYGLPYRMLMDNGAPWGSDMEHQDTIFTVWLMRYGIEVIHCRPCHPQTQGKDERFHRTLKAEVLQGKSFKGIAECQEAFGKWRHVYNFERPHEALGMAVPASRYAASPRSYPEVLPKVEYGPDDKVRRVTKIGWLTFNGRYVRLGKAFAGCTVAVRPTTEDGVYGVYFQATRVARIDLRAQDGAQ